MIPILEMVGGMEKLSKLPKFTHMHTHTSGIKMQTQPAFLQTSINSKVCCNFLHNVITWNQKLWRFCVFAMKVIPTSSR